MKQIIKLLKPSFFKIVVVIALIILQVNCDLALPEYTSKIVNVGIQQSGITEVMPKVISVKSYNQMTLFASKDELKLLDNYKLIKQGNKSYLDDYPILKSNDLYLLKNKNVNNLYKLYIVTQSLNSKQMQNKIPENVLNNLAYLDTNTKAKIIELAFDQINKLDPTIQKQIAINLVTSEYKNAGLDIKKIQTNYIINIGLKMVGVALIGMILAIMIAYLSAIIAASFAKDTRKELVTKIMKFSNKEFNSFSTASLITRSTNDINQLQMFVNMALRIIVYAPILGVGAYLKVMNDEMSWVIGVSVLAILFIVFTLFIFVIPKFSLLQKLVDRINLISREIITGIPVIRSFGTHQKEGERFDSASQDLTKTTLFIGKAMSLMMPLMFFILNATTVLIIWVGADKVNTSGMQVGTLMAFMAYTMQIIMAFLMISMMSIILPRAIVSINRIKEVFNTSILIKDPIKPKSFKKVTGYIKFNQVSFSYNDSEEQVLSNISFEIKPGTTTAIIGSTGSGKSTLLNLLMRFYDVTEGSIEVDGIDIRNVKQSDLRAKFGYVPQKAYLFSGTVASNLKFGVNKTNDSDLQKVIKMAAADEFIKVKNNGLKQEVAQGGNNFSGGQKQRLAIARAIMKKPEFLVFDDSFSALDYKTDIKLRKELNKNFKNGNIIIVAQRISSIMHADQIIVLDQGKIASIGNHQDLIKNCAVYQEIATSQLSKEELANV